MPTRVNNAKADRILSKSEESVVGTQPDTLWHSILDAIPDGISIHSNSGEITWANKKLCNIYGMPLSELKGQSCGQVFHGDGSGAGCPHEQVLAAGHAVELVYEVRVAGRDLSVTIEPLFEELNKPCGFMRVMRDVTRERSAHEQLLKAERFATLGQLLSGVAHDVGTPLNVISGYAEFLLMRTKPEDQGHKEISAILDQTRRIAAMLGKALDLARPAQGRCDAVDIHVLLADSLDLVRHHLRKAGVTAGLTCRIDKPLIYGEAAQLRQAIFNVLLNAGQHIGAGGGLQVVIDSAANRPGFVAIELMGTEANGEGHEFSTDFAVFVAAHSEPETTGIGLHLARKILEEAGARVLVSKQGVGLLIHLPVSAGSRA